MRPAVPDAPGALTALAALEDVSYTYPAGKSPALHRVSLRVQPGELVGVVGANGAGKSTLCYVLSGLAPRFFQGRLTGRVTLIGQEVGALSPATLAQRVGLALQNPLHQLSGARYTVIEEAAFGLENLGVNRDEMLARTRQALVNVGLAELAERSPYELSGGQQQRLALAGLLALDPAVLALDEPTGMLDPQGCREVYTLLEKLRRDGKAIVLAEHRLEWLAEHADRVVVLERGRIVLAGKPDEALAAEATRRAGAGWTRYTQAAYRLRQRGRWPLDRPLPVTLAAAAEGLRAAEGDKRQADLHIAVNRSNGSDGEGPSGRKEGSAGGQANDIRLCDVSFAYPRGIRALRNVSARIEAGACVALIGANGSGKTTLARCLIGLARPQSGQVWLGDWNAAEYTPAQLAHRAAYVFQNPDEQIFARSVWEEVAFGPRNLGCPKAEAARRVERALEQVGLAHEAPTNPRDLDFAGRKWVALASALAMEAPMLALDEPTVGLDAGEVERLGEILAALRREGKTALLITHDLDFAAETCDWALLLSGGRLERQGRAREILADAPSLEECGLVAPQMARLGRALGWASAPVSVDELVDAAPGH